MRQNISTDISLPTKSSRPIQTASFVGLHYTNIGPLMNYFYNESHGSKPVFGLDQPRHLKENQELWPDYPIYNDDYFHM